jgi:hypothetical protein
LSAEVLCTVICVAASPLPAGQPLKLEWNVPITAPQGSYLTWYEAKSDPEDGNNIIVCGMVRNAMDNAYYGVVYSSRDSGKSWDVALEDRNSTWVSEVSCAFGRRHTAYLITEASKVIDGEPHHDLGTTRIFVSCDAGKNWRETAQTGWADFSSSVVGRLPSGENQLYVFYNGRSQFNLEKKLGGTLDFFTVSENGVVVSQRQAVAGLATRQLSAVYPGSSVALNDGSPVVVYSTGKFPSSGLISSYEIGLARFRADGITEATIIATPAVKWKAPICPTIVSNSLVYDRVRSVLYTAYNDAPHGHCTLMVTSSRDGGRTWTPPHEPSGATGNYSRIYFPTLAINQDGIIGMLWRSKPIRSPDCWNFSTLDNALNLDRTISLSPCVPDELLKKQSSAYLATVIYPPDAANPTSIEFMTYRDYLERAEIAVTPDGAFHPVWPTMGDGSGELRTATVRTGDLAQPAPTQAVDECELVDVTEKITVLYAGEQRLDRETDAVTLKLSLRNDGASMIQPPLFLKVLPASSDFGKTAFVNLAPVPSLGRNYVDLSSYFQSGSLATGKATSPFRLTFHISNQQPSAREIDERLRQTVLSLKLQLFSCKQPPVVGDR